MAELLGFAAITVTLLSITIMYYKHKIKNMRNSGFIDLLGIPQPIMNPNVSYATYSNTQVEPRSSVIENENSDGIYEVIDQA